MWTKSVWILGLALLLVSSCVAFKKGEKGRSKRVEEEKAKPISVQKSDDVKIEIMHKPADCKRKSKLGDALTLHYKGKLENGQVFDSSLEREPFTFTLGAGHVIPAWDRGLLGACPLEKRRLSCPPALAYGSQGYPPVIPPNSWLFFDVEVISISTPSESQTVSETQA